VALEPDQAGVQGLKPNDPVRDLGAPLADKARQLSGRVRAMS
jgi:hypothetical protein